MVFIWQRLCYDTEMPYNNLKISEFKMSPLKNIIIGNTYSLPFHHSTTHKTFNTR